MDPCKSNIGGVRTPAALTPMTIIINTKFFPDNNVPFVTLYYSIGLFNSRLPNVSRIIDHFSSQCEDNKKVLQLTDILK